MDNQLKVSYYLNSSGIRNFFNHKQQKHTKTEEIFPFTNLKLQKSQYQSPRTSSNYKYNFKISKKRINSQFNNHHIISSKKNPLKIKKALTLNKEQKSNVINNILNTERQIFKANKKSLKSLKTIDHFILNTQQSHKESPKNHQFFSKGFKLSKRYCDYYIVKTERKTTQNNLGLKIFGNQAPKSQIIDHFKQKQSTEGVQIQLIKLKLSK